MFSMKPGNSSFFFFSHLHAKSLCGGVFSPPPSIPVADPQRLTNRVQRMPSRGLNGSRALERMLYAG